LEKGTKGHKRHQRADYRILTPPFLTPHRRSELPDFDASEKEDRIQKTRFKTEASKTGSLKRGIKKSHKTKNARAAR
jgi:hypothetical protein